MTSATLMRHWVAVASAEHVANGVALGIMQVCHGKGAPLRRIQPGDRVIYYSPTATFRGADRLRHFTAFGIVGAGEPYQVEMSGGFRPFRRDVIFLQAEPAPILPLLEELDFTRGLRNWGLPLRLGLLEISPEDSARIAQAMQVRPPEGCHGDRRPSLEPGTARGADLKRLSGWAGCR